MGAITPIGRSFSEIFGQLFDYKVGVQSPSHRIGLVFFVGSDSYFCDWTISHFAAMTAPRS